MARLNTFQLTAALEKNPMTKNTLMGSTLETLKIHQGNTTTNDYCQHRSFYQNWETLDTIVLYPKAKGRNF